MSESDFINNIRTVFVALKEGRDGYLSHSWYQEYPRECDFLVSLGLCKETHPAVGGKRLELADAHAAALASSKPSPAFVDLLIEEAASYRAKQKARSRQSDDSYRAAVARHQAAMAAVDNDPAAALALAEKEARDE